MVISQEIQRADREIRSQEQRFAQARTEIQQLDPKVKQTREQLQKATISSQQKAKVIEQKRQAEKQVKLAKLEKQSREFQRKVAPTKEAIADAVAYREAMRHHSKGKLGLALASGALSGRAKRMGYKILEDERAMKKVAFKVPGAYEAYSAAKLKGYGSQTALYQAGMVGKKEYMTEVASLKTKAEELGVKWSGNIDTNVKNINVKIEEMNKASAKLYEETFRDKRITEKAMIPYKPLTKEEQQFGRDIESKPAIYKELGYVRDTASYVTDYGADLGYSFGEKVGRIVPSVIVPTKMPSYTRETIISPGYTRTPIEVIKTTGTDQKMIDWGFKEKERIVTPREYGQIGGAVGRVGTGFALFATPVVGPAVAVSYFPPAVELIKKPAPKQITPLAKPTILTGEVYGKYLGDVEKVNIEREKYGKQLFKAKIVAGVGLGLTALYLGGMGYRYATKPIVSKYYSYGGRGRRPLTFKPRTRGVAYGYIKGEQKMIGQYVPEIYPKTFVVKTNLFRKTFGLKPKVTTIKAPSTRFYKSDFPRTDPSIGSYKVSKDPFLRSKYRKVTTFGGYSKAGKTGFEKYISRKIPSLKGKKVSGGLHFQKGYSVYKREVKIFMKPHKGMVQRTYVAGKVGPRVTYSYKKAPGISVRTAKQYPGKMGVFGSKTSPSISPRRAGKVSVIKMYDPKSVPKNLFKMPLRKRVIKPEGYWKGFLRAKRGQLVPPKQLQYAKPFQPQQGFKIPTSQFKLTAQEYAPRFTLQTQLKTPSLVIQGKTAGLSLIGVSALSLQPRLKVKQRTALSLTPKLGTKITQIPNLGIVPVQTQIPKLSLIPRLATVQIPILSQVPTLAPVQTLEPVVPTVPTKIIPKLSKVIALPLKKKVKPQRRTYFTFVKRAGIFKEVGRRETRMEAIKLGERIAKQTLAATFKIKGAAPGVRKTVKDYLPSKREFRTYEIKRGKRVGLKDTWIQKKERRLGRRSEVTEIKLAKRKKGGRRIKIL